MLEGKICLVTGSADGIGRATAVEMAEQGAGGVMVCDINDEKGAETVEMIKAKGVEAEYQHCDMAKPEEIRSLCLAVLGRTTDQLVQLQLAARELADRAATLDAAAESRRVERITGRLVTSEAEAFPGIEIHYP